MHLSHVKATLCCQWITARLVSVALWRVTAIFTVLVEMRILAHLCGDPALNKMIIAGEDIHKAVASIWLGKSAAHVTDSEREQAKEIGYGIIYGMGKSFIRFLLRYLCPFCRCIGSRTKVENYRAKGAKVDTRFPPAVLSCSKLRAPNCKYL
jgi:hypothetical protein